ncbi:DNA-binding response OmpR family regulator [Streptohalobacillus salinus]|uniref:Heme response regulator HssR n=1 Tax=Streptohalobacillus salinus TaxID=621096 RepID=A0A2V3WEJ3_9BACI|nr:response regulator transcription factor [Streptohalobacillus salinus]PXW91521.1 DNA-binding response OmpR family regulator [Streptohalobacillus salinus]
MVNILIADDDQHIRELMRLYLNKEGFNIVEASHGNDAIELLETEAIDLAVIDVMMPELDGIALTKAIRLYHALPIILVTAKGESHDKVLGFEAGADDYLVKPFDPVELVLRVKALLKRYRLIGNHLIDFNGIMLNKNTLLVKADNEIIALKNKEMSLLFELASEPGRIFTRQQLLDKVWSYDYEGDERTVDVHIKRLREKLRTIESIQITTIRGLGYRLEDAL